MNKIDSSEFNPYYINRIVSQFYIASIILLKTLKKYIRRKIARTASKIMISEHRQNKVLDTSISIKSNAECNETAPAISFARFHEDSENLTKPTSKVAVEKVKFAS